MLENADHSKAQHPLAGVILCCTSITTERRDELAKWAVEMGAAHKYDLTSDVTHLVIGHVDTPKYKYVAKERPDVKVVTPEWLAHVREHWLEGGDVDVEKLEAQHRAPTFLGLRICVTGFEDLESRTDIQKRVTNNGGIYDGDLTRAVTHLVALAPKGSKYEHALRWNIKIVALEWIADSEERGMVLDEALYSVRIPKEERGRGAWKRTLPETVPVGKRLRPDNGDDGEGRRKLRRTASSKLSTQSSAIWDELRGGSFIAKQDLGDDSWHEHPQSDGIESQVIPALEETTISKPAPPKPLGCFDGATTCIHGFDKVKTELLAEHLYRHGAVIMNNLEHDFESGFLITPSEMAEDRIDVPAPAQRLTRVNEWWVEKCLHRKQLVDPDHEFICRPLPHIPVSGFENLFITFTSYADYDRLHFAKLIKLMGATYEEYVSEKVSVMICPTAPANNPKMAFCSAHSIPIVSPSWMWACIKIGKVQPFDDYVLEVPREQSRENSQQSLPQRSSENATDRTRRERFFKRGKSTGKLALTSVPRSPSYELPKQTLRTTGNRKQSRQRPRVRPFSQSSSEDEAAENPCPPVADDDHAPPPNVDGSCSPRPLQELSPSRANAARKPPHADSAVLPCIRPSHDQEDALDPGSKSRPSTPPATTSSATITATEPREQPPGDPPANKPSTQETLQTTIAALLAQKKQRPSSAGSNASSAGDPTAAAATAAGSSRSRQQRWRRQLGRAPSFRSDGGTTAADTAPHHAGSVAPSAVSTLLSVSADAEATAAAVTANDVVDEQLDAEAEDSQAVAAAAATRTRQWTDVPGASQTLLWGAAEADDAERAALIRRLGGRVDDDLDRVAKQRNAPDASRAGGGGRLTDAGFVGEGAGGVGSRVGRRRAAAAAAAAARGRETGW
ncbi:BRCT domain-containing protein [Phyllosticta citribraziliensis]|uniref:BRCT domain-containing protein n=1 Tax=Phyllosticta citribraziliensis TaxID=989973 RepID=A0ABR1L6P3_9PEZI